MTLLLDYLLHMSAVSLGLDLGWDHDGSIMLRNCPLSGIKIGFNT